MNKKVRLILAEQFVINQGGKKAVFVADWNDVSIYCFNLGLKDKTCVGLPILMIVDDNECRYTTQEEDEAFYEFVDEHHIKIKFF